MAQHRNNAIVDRLAAYLSADRVIPDDVVEEIKGQLHRSMFKYDYFLHKAKERVEVFRKAQSYGVNTAEYETYTLDQLSGKMEQLIDRSFQVRSSQIGQYPYFEPNPDYTAEDKLQHQAIDAEVQVIHLMRSKFER